VFVTNGTSENLEKCTFLSASGANRNIPREEMYKRNKRNRSRSNKKSPSEEGYLSELFYL
jgi:hypothetical protein